MFVLLPINSRLKNKLHLRNHLYIRLASGLILVLATELLIFSSILITYISTLLLWISQIYISSNYFRPVAVVPKNIFLHVEQDASVF